MYDGRREAHILSFPSNSSLSTRSESAANAKGGLLASGGDTVRVRDDYPAVMREDEQLERDGQDDTMSRRLCAQTSAGVLERGLDGAVRDEALTGDLIVGAAHRCHSQELALPRRQPRRRLQVQCQVHC